jgi:tetratricopeptide (TPR) repeat protein
MNFCPECGAKVGGSKFCPECGKPLLEGAGENNVIQRSTLEARGPVEDSVVSRSSVRTDRASIKDAVISHSTITQTETHQHFGESVGTYETQVELGRTAFEGKNFEEAVEFFNNALKIDSKSYEPWFLKGLACAELRRTDEAVTNLRRALRSSDRERVRIVEEIKGLVDRITKSAMVLETQANDLLSKANVELQYSYQYKSGAKSEKEGGMMGALALDLFVMPGLGSSMRTTSAVDGLEKKQEADKREAEGKKLEDQAKDLLSSAIKQYNSAIRFCDLVIEFFKEDEFSYMKRGEIFLRLKLYTDACKSYESVLSFNPYHRDALRLRGMCFHAQGLLVPPPPGPKTAPVGPQQQPQMPQTHPSPVPPQQPQIPQAPISPAPKPQPVPPAVPSIPPVLPVAPATQSQTARSLPPQPGQQSVQPSMQAGGALPATAPRAPAPPHHPAAAQVPGPAQRPAPALLNPCPYCRSEMSFVKERGVWFCGSCRRFSDRPTR